ncbi:pyridoxamine 5'-phosphate oxidase family protein [Nitrosophilus kaiyonis]|uniref:pyridoxamine 5'-phosphate oxidase family protein n=1 Tax=Nitrosophilus kaiyonis TaxID=2930200 RepID=UPI0024900C89|nr:pyridoxamine 5'-phosphate oxidase family protein [Nitrosophilus kaiyonis]
MNTKLEKFLESQHIMTICTSSENIPYCATCFYVYDKKRDILIFASDEDTLHIKLLKKNIYASGTIFLDTKKVSKIEGVQFQGSLLEDIDKESQKIYFEKFPFTKAINPKLWGIKIKFLKYTNNSFGFGKKIIIGKTFFENS